MSVQQGRAINFLKGLHVKLGLLWRAALVNSVLLGIHFISL